MDRDRIFVNGLRDMALIGVLPEERLVRQPVQVDLEIATDLAAAAASDDLERTVNYGAVADAVRALVVGTEDLLLERLAGRIASCVLGFDGVEAVTVRLTKLRPPIEGDIDSTAVQLHRPRSLARAGGPHGAVVALGSNLGDRLAHLRFALGRLGEVRASSVWETAPVGGPDDQGPYLNMVAAFETTLDPWTLLARLHEIEADAGRRRDVHWGPRTLDLDLLFHDDTTVDGRHLVLPHPRISERRFVLEPLEEVAPDRCPRGWRDSAPTETVRRLGRIDEL
jgi:dihydroneopterin aldolase/2-amino-4-hydroxy-6-hydroxymethyldihydropteridine diphosphokinase